MRQITDIKRNKRTFNLSLEEFRSGNWLKEVPNSDLVEVLYKNNYLTISDCKIRKLEENKQSEKEETENGKRDE